MAKRLLTITATAGLLLPGTLTVPGSSPTATCRAAAT